MIMFTGIIDGLGTLTAVRTGGAAGQLAIVADFDLKDTRVGDSVAVNGACLTVTALQGRRFTVDISPETVSRTTFQKAMRGQKVNLERALCLADRLDGHLVTGHVDGVGRLENREVLENAIVLTFSAPQAITYYIIEKGSVALDGISLTVNQCDTNGFVVSIIPYTSQITTIGLLKIGQSVNIETDLIGKYVERFVKGDKQTSDLETGNAVDLNLLAKSGFLDK
jgi:riboflavin synthase